MKEYMKQYQDYLILAKWMTKVFNYIDRYFLKFSNTPSTVQCALQEFKDNVFVRFKEVLIESVLEQFKQWREGVDVNWRNIHAVIETFITIGITKNATIGANPDSSLKWTGEQNLNEYDTIFE